MTERQYDDPLRWLDDDIHDVDLNDPRVAVTSSMDRYRASTSSRPHRRCSGRCSEHQT
jgi:hypothetical protein